MQELIDLVRGYKEFSSAEKLNGRYRYGDLAESQSPKIMVISCSDSRVIPSHIFNVKPGELFVVRNVANLVPPYEEDGTYHGTSAALEFAVTGLNVKKIVVLGHSQCGGIQACAHNHLHNKSTGIFIDKWLSIIQPVAERVYGQDKQNDETEGLHALEIESIKHSIENLKKFPFIAERLLKKELSLNGAHFDIQDGQLYIMNPSTGEFEKVD